VVIGEDKPIVLTKFPKSLEDLTIPA
jgi:hypothetical protein